MSLLDALLLDSYRMNLWVAYRTDGVAGSGTQSDPFDGSIQAKFDGLMKAMPIAFSSITNVSSTATASVINHPYQNGDMVLIDGVTGPDATHYNGPYTISGVIANSFTYTTANGPPSGPVSGQFSCRLTSASGPKVALGVNPPLAIRVGPGTFVTNGYADAIATGGWQPRPGMKIAGSGVDVTTLQVAGSSSSSTAHLYAIGHAVSPGGLPNLLDYFEVCDLTIDCNLGASTGGSIASGAVRVMGNHAKVRRIKVMNWGTKSTANPCFVASVVTASDTGWVEDCGIEECIAITPYPTGNSGPITIFHAGGTESTTIIPTAYGVAPYIRNCFADAGQNPPSANPEIHGLSLAWCKGGILEGNQVHNLTYGTFQQPTYGPLQQPTNAQDVIVRNNWFKNVNKGILAGGLDGVLRSGSLSRSGTIATVTVSSGPIVSTGDWVVINTNPTGPFNGIVALVTGVSSNQFTFNTSITSSNSATVSAIQKVFGVTNLIVEGNVVELATATSGTLIGIHVQDGSLGTTPQDSNYPLYVFSKVLLRDNKLRYVDGAINPGYAGYPIQANSATNLLVRNNVVESDPANPLRNDRCLSVVYFNNLTPAGVLQQGWNGDNGATYEELSTIADFALIMGLFNRKA
jgi:hypothetical protein